MSRQDRDAEYIRNLEEVPDLLKYKFFNGSTGVGYRHVGKMVLGRPRAQGGCSSCVACVVADNIAAVLALVQPDVAQRVLKYLSAQHIVDCQPNSREEKDDCGCKASSFEEVYAFLETIPGIVEEVNLKYRAKWEKCIDSKCPEAKKGLRNDFRFYPRVRVGGCEDPDSADFEVMKNIIEIRPVGPQVVKTTAFDNHCGSHIFRPVADNPKCTGPKKKHGKSGKTGKSEKSGKIGTTARLVHAVLIIGYGTDPDDGTNFYIIKNSWAHDEDWGCYGGYTKISADTVVGKVFYPKDVSWVV